MQINGLYFKLKVISLKNIKIYNKLRKFRIK